MTQMRVEDMWPLSPMQEGLLFHADTPATGPGRLRRSARLRPHGAVDAEVLRASWAALLDRHANLRAGFRGAVPAERPVQLVARHVEPPWRYGPSPPAPRCALAEIARPTGQERDRRFDPAEPPLLRLLW